LRCVELHVLRFNRIVVPSLVERNSTPDYVT
jgi:hypothetical protein